MILALFTLSAAQAVAPPARVSLTPTTAADAVEAFDRLCLANFPDERRFRRAIGQAPGYAAVEGGQQWRSPHAVVSYVRNDGVAARQCGIDTLLDRAPDGDALIAAVQGRLRAHLGRAPAPVRAEGMILWVWQEDGAEQRVILDLPAAPARQASLSVQRLK